MEREQEEAMRVDVADAHRRADRARAERAHRDLRNTDDYRERLAIARDLERAASSASVVGMDLGAWAARGDWATLSENSRTHAGQRALIGLDAALNQLRVVREHLVATLAAQHTRDTADRAVPGHQGDQQLTEVEQRSIEQARELSGNTSAVDYEPNAPDAARFTPEMPDLGFGPTRRRVERGR
ncbi:hypothetical protein [Nocardia sp. NPDC057030]|uniref:hypothetical protein n=1 Tax=unclassified Nocardia TaxID=2637762 RepID=UPI00363DEA6A